MMNKGIYSSYFDYLSVLSSIFTDCRLILESCDENFLYPGNEIYIFINIRYTKGDPKNI